MGNNVKNYSMSVSIKDFLRGIPFFYGIPDDHIDALLRTARLQEYKKGDYLFRQDESVECLHFIRDGWVRLYRGNSDGEEGTAHLYTKGDVLGEGVVLGPGIKRFCSAQAVGDTLAYSIPALVVRESAINSTIVMNRLMQSIMAKMNRIHVEAEHMASMDAPQRVACLLLRLMSHMIGKGGTFTFPYDKSLAAVQLGMKRETFSRALAQLREQGVKSSGSEVTVESFAHLSGLCCSHCSLSAECSGARCVPSPFFVPAMTVNPVVHHHNFHGA